MKGFVRLLQTESDIKIRNNSKQTCHHDETPPNKTSQVK